MQTSNNYLAIDLGAESGRAMLGQLDGRKLTLTEACRFPNGPVRLPDSHGFSLHWDVLKLWEEIKGGLASVINKQSVHPASIGLDTWGVDFGLLDNQGHLIGNPYHYRDNRTDGMLETAFSQLSRQKIFEATGIQFMQINSLYQLLSMVVNKSPELETAGTFLMMPDLFNYWLTGQKVSEFTIASSSQCYDPRAKNWATPLLSALGIPRHIFPEIVQPASLLGEIHPEIADEVGAKKVLVVAPACHDTGSAVAAVPAEGKNFVWISSGTWSIMGIETGEAIINQKSLDFNFTNEGGSAGTFRFCKNIMGLWLVQECRRTWTAQGQKYSYAELTDMADKSRPLVSLLDPDSDDFLKPGDMPARIQAFCRKSGQVVPETPGAIVRCTLDSIALKYRWVLERLEEITGQHLDPIHIIGGGTQNQLLNQLAADSTGRNVIAGPIEATAIGNILVQAIALGHLDSIADARAVVRQSFEPQVYKPQRTADWDAAYNRYLKVIS